MYTLRFRIRGDIRMGSPFNVAEVILAGAFVPVLKDHLFQDRGFVAEDGTVCYLVQWSIGENNDPGFVVWKISESSRSVLKSLRIEGCCESIAMEDGEVVVKSYQHPNSVKLKVEFSSP